MRNEREPKTILWLLIFLVLAGFVVAVNYLGRESRELAKTLPSPNGNASRRESRIYTVYYSLGIFSPTNIRIHIGDSVKFQNDSNGRIHIVSEEDNNGSSFLPGFDSVSEIHPDSAFTYTFIKEGTFGYYNIINPNEGGAVIVRP